VNKKVIRTPDQWVDPQRDCITLDGRPLRVAKRIYLLLYKPTGYITSYKDPEGRPTVYDLLTDMDEWVFPVGRLDLDTSGLLLMTNDAQFAERVSNPAHKVPKSYLVKTSSLVTSEQLEKLRNGIVLLDGPTRPAQVTHLRDLATRTFFEITITEGRNRQVRRMVEALGSKVSKLVRTAIGPLRIGDLQIGKWRLLTTSEVRLLAPSRSNRPPHNRPRLAALKPERSRG
jgi:pseudouridine synthase